MPSRRVLRTVLHNFLGTFVSRYSDYRGYWLIGQLEPWLGGWEVDLLGSVSAEVTPEVRAFSHLWAIAKFRDQLERAGVHPSRVATALVRVVPLVPASRARLRRWNRDGRNWVFGVWVTTDTGRRFHARRTVFVAPHDPQLESRLDEEYWGTMASLAADDLTLVVSPPPGSPNPGAPKQRDR